MGRINRKTLIFLAALGLVIYSIRGAPTTESKWQAAKVLWAFIAIMIVVKVAWTFIRRNSSGEADE